MSIQEPLKVFIGFDQVEAIAYHTLCHSIISRASVPVSIIPIKRSMLRDMHNRPIDPKQSNEFSFIRFLVPYLSGYTGRALFMDCDMMLRTDIKNLFDLADMYSSVQVVKHDYTPHDSVKYLNSIQYQYPKKNWSSVMLFNCNNSSCRRLTPEYVNSASGLDLHQFKWCPEDRVGELPKEWNHLVGEYPPNPDAKIVHWTVGGPYFEEYTHCEFAEEWFYERQMMQHCSQRKNIVKIAGER